MEKLSEQLLQLYRALNKRYFEGVLPPILIEISFAEKMTSWGIRNYNNKQYGIVVNWYSLESENNLYIDMIHQMIHISNSTKGIIDSSGRGRYHNANWKEEAQRIGLKIGYDNLHGYYAKGIKKPYIAQIRKVFDYEKYRRILDAMKCEDAKDSTQTVLFKCPQCGRLVRTRVTNKINCGFCLCEYIMVD